MTSVWAIVRRPWAGWAIAVGLVALAPLILRPIDVFLLSLAMVYAIAAIGLTVLTGYSGQVSLGQVAFFAIGAYVGTWFQQVLHLPFLAALLAAGACAAALAYIIGLPIIRFRGLYLAVATLALSQGVVTILTIWDYTGGYLGFKIPQAEIAGYAIDTDLKFYGFVSSALLLAVLLVRNLLRSRMGRALSSIRQSEVGAQAAGVNLAHYKIQALAVSAFLTSCSGSLYGALLRTVTIDQFSLWISLAFLFMIFVGGQRSIVGAVVGSIFYVFTPQLLRDFALTRPFPDVPNILFGLVFLFAFLFAPDGLVGLASGSRWSRRLMGRG